MAFSDDLNNYSTRQSDIFNQQQGTLNNGITDRNNAVSGLQGELGYADTITNLNNARKSLYNTQNVLDNLPQDVDQRLTSNGGLTTQGQRDRVLASEQQPLTRSVNAQSGAVSANSSNLDTINNAVNSLIGVRNNDITNKLGILGNAQAQNLGQFNASTNYDTNEINNQSAQTVAGINAAAGNLSAQLAKDKYLNDLKIAGYNADGTIIKGGPADPDTINHKSGTTSGNIVVNTEPNGAPTNPVTISSGVPDFTKYLVGDIPQFKNQAKNYININK